MTLTYNSLTADPRPILTFGYSDVTTPEPYLAAEISISRGDFEYTVPGYQPTTPDPDLENLNFWQIPSGATAVSASIQINLQNEPTGEYNFTINAALMDPSDPADTPLGTTTGTLLVVNNTDSPFGQGWGIAGLEQLYVNPDGTVLLVDGDGSDELFHRLSRNKTIRRA